MDLSLQPEDEWIILLRNIVMYTQKTTRYQHKNQVEIKVNFRTKEFFIDFTAVQCQVISTQRKLGLRTKYRYGCR